MNALNEKYFLNIKSSDFDTGSRLVGVTGSSCVHTQAARCEKLIIMGSAVLVGLVKIDICGTL